MYHLQWTICHKAIDFMCYPKTTSISEPMEAAVSCIMLDPCGCINITLSLEYSKGHHTHNQNTCTYVTSILAPSWCPLPSLPLYPCIWYSLVNSVTPLRYDFLATDLIYVILFYRRIGESLETCLPNLETLVLTGNLIHELVDLEPLTTLPRLTCLSLLYCPCLLYTSRCV